MQKQRRCEENEKRKNKNYHYEVISLPIGPPGISGFRGRFLS